MESLFTKLKEVHGTDLNLADDVYYLFFKDGVMVTYLDQDKKQLQVELSMLPEGHTHVYHIEESLEDLINKTGGDDNEDDL